MDSLPIELVTIIACDSFELFTTLLHVPTIGNRLCEQYPQMIARSKFISIWSGGYVTRTYLNGRLHSIDDQPAIINIHECVCNYWYKYGKKHRGGDLPAYVNTDGSKAYYWNGLYHRDDNLPAIEFANGEKAWFIHGEYVKES